MVFIIAYVIMNAKLFAYSGKSERQFRNIGTAFRSKQNE